ncbi:MAG: AAA family ATPase, partial [Planctomycetota bacterium]|nr:AAA family ATPase [Planctomycetota bacterium]
MFKGSTWDFFRSGPRTAAARDAAWRATAKSIPAAPTRTAAKARVLCVASGKGGTGKSVIASNIAVLRAKRGEKVLLIDFDAGMANAHLLLGVQPKFDLGHVLDGEVSAAFAAVQGPHGLFMISGGVGRASLLNPTPRELERLFTALAPLENEFDLIVVDHGAGLSYATLAHLAAAQKLLLVTTHEVTSLSDAYALYKQATIVNGSIHVGVVLNRVPDEIAAKSAWTRFHGAASKFLAKSPEFIGWVPHDEAVSHSVQARQPITLREPDSPAGLAIARVANWSAIDEARINGSFYEAARRA